MQLITKALEVDTGNLETISLKIDRHKLARKRWRHSAEDGIDFGTDLEEPLSHGDVIYTTESKAYIIEQQPEACFQIALPEPANAAWTGWMIGNLHFKAAFSEDGILVPDDLAVEQMLEREHIHFHRVNAVFQPSKNGGHSHDHDHSHSHSHSH